MFDVVGALLTPKAGFAAGDPTQKLALLGLMKEMNEEDSAADRQLVHRMLSAGCSDAERLAWR